jgi:hypothetical protein
MVASSSTRCLPHLQSRFLTILPRIKNHARIYFRHQRCGFKKADCISETIALAWKWLVRLAEKGKDATKFPSALATLAARAVRSGRRVYGQNKSNDAMNEHAQQRHSFTVDKLPDFSTLSSNPYQEALIDNTVSPVPDQVALRMDWPAWLKTRTHKDRDLIADMARRERTKDLSEKFKLSQGRISQLRSQYHEDWERYCAEPELQ